MFKTYQAMLLCVFVLLTTSATFAAQKIELLKIDGLESEKADQFPSKWRPWPFQRSTAAKVYSVKEDGDLKYLHAYDDKGHSAQIFKRFYWPIDKYPYLNWKWRAKILPKGAKEDQDSTNDSACGVYVIFGQMKGHAMKYVWSSSLPKGQIVSRREDKLKIKVIESSGKKLNKWQKQTINVPDEYKKMFGRDLDRNPSGIAILTDGNAVNQPTSCDYADFIISTKAPL